MAKDRASIIAQLNDQCRAEPHLFFQTEGILGFSEEEQAEIREKVAQYDTFTEENDPYGERDFGSLEYKGRKIFWKISYYDPNFLYHSENPADPSKTERVLTVMLAEEY